MPTLAMTLAPECIGRYRIRGLLARGGMGEVFAAEQTGPGGFRRLCALKVILPDLAADERFTTLLVNEARIAATLAHPNIVQVIDVGEVQGTCYIAMELVNGLSLATLLARGRTRSERVPIPVATSIVRTVLEALHYAHTRQVGGQSLGIVHRDVSARNVLVAHDGLVKLIDFGIAKAAFSSQRTQTGTIQGTRQYMAPELLLGGPADAKSDVYSAGVLLYELLAGSRPFSAASEDELVLKVMTEHPPDLPGARGEAIPSRLLAVIERALAKEAAVRFPSAGRMAEELQAIAEAERWPSSTRFIEAWVRPLCADTLATFEQLEKEALTPGSGVVPARPVDAPAVELPETLVAIPRGDSSARGARAQGTWRAWRAGPLLAVLLVGMAALLWHELATDRPVRSHSEPRRARAPAPAPLPPAAPATKAGAPAAPSVVTLDVHTDPPGCAVFLDGRAVGRTPLRMQQSYGTQPLRLVVERTGYRAYESTITPTGDLRLDLVLERTRTGRGRRANPAAAPSPTDPRMDDLVEPR